VSRRQLVEHATVSDARHGADGLCRYSDIGVVEEFGDESRVFGRTEAFHGFQRLQRELSLFERAQHLRETSEIAVHTERSRERDSLLRDEAALEALGERRVNASIVDACENAGRSGDELSAFGLDDCRQRRHQARIGRIAK
jgi:hypothetical protein